MGQRKLPSGWTGRALASARPAAESKNVLTVVGEDLACTVDLEHMERTQQGRTHHRVLRCTQVYRLEDGEWRVIVRHADELPETGASRR